MTRTCFFISLKRELEEVSDFTDIVYTAMKRAKNVPTIVFQQVDCEIDERSILRDLAEIILFVLEAEKTEEALQNQGDPKEMNQLPQTPKSVGPPLKGS